MTFLRRNCEGIILNTGRKPFFVNEFLDREGLLALYHELQDELFPTKQDVMLTVDWELKVSDDKPD